MTPRTVRYPFSDPLVRAIMRGAKTETRRILPADPEKMQKAIRRKAMPGDEIIVCEGLVPRDVVLVDGLSGLPDATEIAAYSVDDEPARADGHVIHWRWKVRKLSSRYMPTEACRTRRRCVETCVEHLQDITAASILAEGVVDRPHEVEGLGKCPVSAIDGCVYPDLVRLWAHAWNTIHPKPGERWEDNPAVHVTRWEALDPAGG